MGVIAAADRLPVDRLQEVDRYKTAKTRERVEIEKGRAGALEKARPKIEQDRDAPASDNGNNVDFEREQTQLEKNALLHQLATFVVNQRLNQLRSAIRGSP